MNNIFLLLREYNNNLCMKKFKFLLLSAQLKHRLNNKFQTKGQNGVGTRERLL